MPQPKAAFSTLGPPTTTTVSTADAEIEDAGRHLLVFDEKEGYDLSVHVQPQIPSFRLYAECRDESLWHLYDRRCKRTADIKAAMEVFSSTRTASAWSSQDDDEQLRAVCEHLHPVFESRRVSRAVLAIGDAQDWKNALTLCEGLWGCKEPHMFSGEELARLEDPEIREPVYMVSVGDNHEGGSWTLCTSSGLHDTKRLSETSEVVQRALDRFHAVVEGYTVEHQIALTQQLEQETGRTPSDFDLACHVAQQYKDGHPYVRHCELVFLGPTDASEDGCSCKAGPSGPSKVPATSLSTSGQVRAACRSAVSALRARMSRASENPLEVSTPTRTGEMLRRRDDHSRLGEGNEDAK